jgi:chemotaxis-related protein WspB
MLLLLFTLGEHRYALEARKVIEVVPLAQLKPIPRAPLFVAGLLNYRGVPVPVLDLTQMNQASPSRACMSTRIILVDYIKDDATSRILGLMAERVTETIKRNTAEFQPTGVATPDAPYLGPISNDNQGMLQLMDINRLLPPDVHALLFTPASAA